MKTFKEFIEDSSFEEYMIERVWRSTNWNGRIYPRLILPGSELRDPRVPIKTHPHEPRETVPIEELPINKRVKKQDKKNRLNIK